MEYRQDYRKKMRAFCLENTKYSVQSKPPAGLFTISNLQNHLDVEVRLHASMWQNWDSPLVLHMPGYVRFFFSAAGITSYDCYFHQGDNRSPQVKPFLCAHFSCFAVFCDSTYSFLYYSAGNKSVSLAAIIISKSKKL